MKRENLIGKKFGRLTVLNIDNNKSKCGNIYWRCECECGNIISVKPYNLKSGHTKSCGCLAKELQSEIKNNLIGKKFGRLTVLDIDNDKRKPGKLYYLCKCECGNIISVLSSKLINGHTKSCGCLKIGTRNNLIGKKFGRWTVLSLDNEREIKHGQYYYICKCKCGVVKSVSAQSLLNGSSKSCGCLHNEITSIISQNNCKYNKIYINEKLGYGIGFFFNKPDEYFLFDIEDLELVKNRCWHKDSNGYAASHNKQNNKNEYMHRLIMMKYKNIDGFVIDHINHNQTDNRKNNLRLCSIKENLMNSKFNNSITGDIYIHYDYYTNKYVVSIPNENNIYFDYYWDAINYRAKYTKNIDFIYDYKNDIRNIINNTICPFFNITDFNDNAPINPFIILDKDKFDKSDT